MIALKDSEIEALNKALVQSDIKMDQFKAIEKKEKEELKSKIIELEKRAQSYKEELEEYIEIFDKT